MKAMKKLLALVLTLALLVSAVPAFAAFPDVDAEASYADAVETLAALGIILGDDQGNYNPDKTVLRSEMATIICRCLGLADSAAASADANVFSDVPGEHWAAGYINAVAVSPDAEEAAKNAAVFVGYPDGTFLPDKEVTAAEAIKMVVAALGYTPKANRLGGYPAGYVNVASQEGVLKNVSVRGNAAAKRSDIASMIYNALDVQMMGISEYAEDEKDKYAVVDDSFANKIEVVIVEGVITSIPVKGTDEKITFDVAEVNDNYAEDDITVGNNTFYKGDLDVDAFFNKKVTLYVDVSTSKKTAIFAVLDDDNEILKIEADELKDVTAITGGFSIDYYTTEDHDEDDVDTITVANNFYVNTIAKTIADKPAFLACMADGVRTIEFVKNDDESDFDYDATYFSITKDYFVDEITSASRQKVSASYYADSTGSTLDSRTLTFDVDNYTTTFYKNGAIASFADIAEEDVLTCVFKTNTGAYTENCNKVVYISSQNIEGTVTGKDDTEKEVRISGTYYECEPAVFASGKVNNSKDGKFYFNYSGRIAFADASAAAGNYAVITEIYEEQVGGKDYAYIVYFDATGKKFTKRVNNTSVQLCDEAGEELAKGAPVVEENTSTTENGTLDVDGYDFVLGNYGSLVSLKINSSDEITKITNYAANTLSNDNYKSAGTLKGNDITDSTIIIGIDALVTSADGVQAKDVTIYDASIFKTSQGYNGYYDYDDDEMTIVMLQAPSTTLAKNSENLMVVTKTVSGQTEDYDDFVELTGYVNGEEQTIIWVDDFTDVYDLTDIAADTSYGVSEVSALLGEMILFEGTGEVNAIRVVKGAAGSFTLYTDEGEEEDDVIVATDVYVESKSNGKIVVPGEDALKLASGYRVYRYNDATGKVREADSGDIEIFDGTTGTKISFRAVEDAIDVILILE